MTDGKQITTAKAKLQADIEIQSQTRAFLTDVLPTLESNETYIYGTLPGGYYDSGREHAMPAQYAASADELANKALRLDWQGQNLYFSQAAFPRFADRKTENVRRIRALRVDFDVVGRDGKNTDKKYATKDEAWCEAERLAHEFMPASWIIDSGHGYHVYWVLDQTLTASDWKLLAGLFQLWLAANNFRADTAITTNVVAVLRVVGTNNRKYANEQLRVTVMRRGEHISLEAVRAKLAGQVATRDKSASLVTVDIGLGPAPSWFDPLGVEQKKQTILSLCAALPVDLLNTYDYWLAVIADIRAAIGLSDEEKLDLAIEASRRTESFDEQELRSKWSGLTRGNVGALINRAKAAGWKRPAEAYPSRFGRVADFHSYLNEEGWALVCGGRGEREYIAPNNHPVSVESFGDLFNTRMPDGKGAHLLATRDGGVRKVSSVIYRPGRERFFGENGCPYVNTWSECRHEAIEPTKEEQKIFWRPIKHLIAGDLETQKGIIWFLRLLAWKQQHRDKRIPVFPVLIGEIEGSGKSTLFYDLAVAALGADNVGNINNAEVSSSFTDWVGEKEWIVLHEMKINNHKEAAQIANSLKTIVTDKMVRQVRKGKSGRTIANISTYVGTSNHMDAAHLSDSDRRYFAIHTKALRMPVEIAKPWHDLLESVRGPGIVRYELEKLDISGFDPYAPPMESEARRRMMAASRSDVEDAVFTAYENGEGCFVSDIVSKKCVTALVREKVGRNIAERSVLNALEKYCDSKSKRIAARDNDDKVEKPWVYFIRNHGKWLEATGAEQMAEYKRGLSAQLLM